MAKIVFSLVLFNQSLEDIYPLLKSIQSLNEYYSIDKKRKYFYLFMITQIQKTDFYHQILIF